jgi:MFS family permease
LTTWHGEFKFTFEGSIMSKRFAAFFLALALFLVTYAVNLSAPLYDVYAQHSGVGAIAVTTAFAAYVGGLMPTLMLLGGLSDRIGRRTPIAFALALGGVATLLLGLWPNMATLIVARLLLGIGTGLATTSGTAYMIDILGRKRQRTAALIVTSATSLGFGGGALATGISLVIQGPTVLPLSYIILIASVPIMVCAVWALPRAEARVAVSLLRWPIFPAGTWMFGLAMALAWSTSGMIIAIVPLELAKNNLGGWTGLVVFLAIFIGFLCQPIARRMTNSRALVLGFCLVPFGFFVLLIGVWLQALVLVLIGTSITSAASYGFTYLAALSEMTRRVPDDHARATAGVFVYAYLGFSVPVMMAGALADILGLVPAMIAFEVALCAGTLGVAMRWRYLEI